MTPARGSYVSDTGGSGVRHRDDCREAARTGEAGLAEGQRVLREARGINRCEGWSVVRAGGRQTWVSNGYLSEIPPRAPAPRATPTPAQAACEIEDAASRVVAGTVLVLRADGGTGTAFYVGDGEFVPAAHVVDDVLSVILRSARVDVRADVQGLHHASDIASLSADASPCRAGAPAHAPHDSCPQADKAWGTGRPGHSAPAFHCEVEQRIPGGAVAGYKFRFTGWSGCRRFLG